MSSHLHLAHTQNENEPSHANLPKATSKKRNYLKLQECDNQEDSMNPESHISAKFKNSIAEDPQMKKFKKNSGKPGQFTKVKNPKLRSNPFVSVGKNGER